MVQNVDAVSWGQTSVKPADLPWLKPAKKRKATGSAGPGLSARRRPVGRGTYRTLCVRICDGFYFPISFRVRRSKFSGDANACEQRCTGADARLFVYRDPGQKIASAVDLKGNRYKDLPNAFRYRKKLVKGCGCNPSDLLRAGVPEQ